MPKPTLADTASRGRLRTGHLFKACMPWSKDMKRSLAGFIALVGLLCGTASQAALELRRGGTMVYDTVANLTWIRDAGIGGMKTQGDAMAWASGLVYEGVSGWRLPQVRPVNGMAAGFDLNYAEDGSTDAGLNISGMNSELGFLYYTSLGNADGIYGTGLTNRGPFQNLGVFNNANPFGAAFWTSATTNPDYSFGFFMGIGSQEELENSTLAWAWAVRDGDVDAAAVPEPETLPLLGVALLGAWTLRRKHLTTASR